jgi:hypothetical protein
MRILRRLPLLALLAACSDTSGPGAPDVRISTTVNRAALPGQPNVAITVENRGSRPVLLHHCGDRLVVMVDRRENGEWKTYKGGICTADLTWGPVELAAGAGISAQEWITEQGRYRLRLDAAYPQDFGAERGVVSTTFEIQ